MNCRESKELIPGLVMDALPEEETAGLDQHLAGCADCRSELEAVRGQFGLLGQWSDATPPTDLVDKTMARLSAERAPAPAASWWARLGRALDGALGRFASHRPGWASGLVTALVAGLLFVQVLSPNWLRGRSSGSVIGCRSNLRMLCQALDRYAADHQGKYPNRLAELSPAYIKSFPDCPSAGSGTYVDGYSVSADHLHYTLNCRGYNHQEAGLAPNQPESSK